MTRGAASVSNGSPAARDAAQNRGQIMQKSHTAFFSASILALGLLGYGLAPGAANSSGAGDSQLHQASQSVEDCGPLAIPGREGCARSEDAASIYGQLNNADGSTTVWSLTFSERGDTQVRRYRDLLLTADGQLEYETVITVELGSEGRRELREIRDANGETVFREVRRSGAEGAVEVEQMPVAGDPEEVIAVLQRAATTLQQALALSPSV